MNATPTAAFSLALPLDSESVLFANVKAQGPTTATRAEFTGRNAFSRTAAGVSARDGTANGIQDSVVNNFTGPKPSMTWGDPSASNIATLIITGKAATTIRWVIVVRGLTGTPP